MVLGVFGRGIRILIDRVARGESGGRYRESEKGEKRTSELRVRRFDSGGRKGSFEVIEG